jgi:hypothetical protein
MKFPITVIAMPAVLIKPDWHERPPTLADNPLLFQRDLTLELLATLTPGLWSSIRFPTVLTNRHVLSGSLSVVSASMSLSRCQQKAQSHHTEQNVNNEKSIHMIDLVTPTH